MVALVPPHCRAQAGLTAPIDRIFSLEEVLEPQERGMNPVVEDTVPSVAQAGVYDAQNDGDVERVFHIPGGDAGALPIDLVRRRPEGIELTP